MIAILIKFFKGGCLRTLILHRKYLCDMSSYFAVTGNNLNTMSFYIYLAYLQTLERKNSNVCKHFLEGHHVIYRSDR